MMKQLFLVSMAMFAISGCRPSSENLSTLQIRSMTVAEAQSDLRELANAVETLYGPLKYKENRYRYTFNDLYQQAHQDLALAQSDEEMLGIYSKLLAKLDDSHVGIEFKTSGSGVRSYNIAVFVTPFEDKAIVTSLDQNLSHTGIAVGDELLSVDGQSVDDIYNIARTYEGLANPISQRHQIYLALNRPSFMTELRPQNSHATLELQRADGSRYIASVAWNVQHYVDNSSINRPSTHEERTGMWYQAPFAQKVNASAGFDVFGGDKPVFLTDAVKATYGLTEVAPNAEFLTKYGLDPAKYPYIYAGLYRHQGKTVLLIRQPRFWNDVEQKGFDNATYMKAYRAILDQYEEFADVLVVDQTHNGGGSYCEEFFTLFIQEPKNGFVQNCNADRKWIIDLQDWGNWDGTSVTSEQSRLYMSYAAEAERAYDAGEDLTRPLPIIGGLERVNPDSQYTWKKPFVVLIDELSFSCADAFPMLIKHNQVAKLFGERTNGAGGNIEPVVDLSNSRASVRLTRGLFTSFDPSGTYATQNYVENNGIQPDEHYTHTVADYRQGYVDYVGAFSDYAVSQLP
jgi:hypothetical protein